MESAKWIVYALRCSSKPGGGKCTVLCPYRMLEEAKPEIPIKPNAVIDGVGYLESCDVDRIARDAADMIERLQRRF